MAKKKKKVESSTKRARKYADSGLGEALSDISKELAYLKRQKQKLIKREESIGTKTLTVQNRERSLRDRITKLVALESELSNKKNISEVELQNIIGKIRKIKKIKEELGEV